MTDTRLLKYPFAKVANHLWEIGAIKLKGPDNPDGFRLKLHEAEPDRPLSPFYMNLRSPDNPKPGPLTEESYGLIADMLYGLTLMYQMKFDAICGLPRAGDPIAQALATLLADKNQPTRVIPLVKENLVGGTRRIIGTDEDLTGLVVLVVDDLITKAESKREGITALRSMGAEVADVLVLVDREQGGTDELVEDGVTLLAALGITALLDHYLANGVIYPQVYDEAIAYLADS